MILQKLILRMQEGKEKNGKIWIIRRKIGT